MDWQMPLDLALFRDGRVQSNSATSMPWWDTAAYPANSAWAGARQPDGRLCSVSA